MFFLQGKKDLVAVDSTEYEDENGNLGDSENEEIHDETQQDSSNDVDSDEERRRFFFTCPLSGLSLTLIETSM